MNNNSQPNNQFDELLSPDMVRLVTNPDRVQNIDPGFFPISETEIDNMPIHLDKINTIITHGGVEAIGLDHVRRIQEFIRENNPPKDINTIKIHFDKNVAVWLYFYISWLRRDKLMLELYEFNIDTPIGQGNNPDQTRERLLKIVRGSKGMDDLLNRIRSNNPR